MENNSTKPEQVPHQAQATFRNQFCKAKSVPTWVTSFHHLVKKEKETKWQQTESSQVRQSTSVEPTCFSASTLARQRWRGWQQKISVPR